MIVAGTGHRPDKLRFGYSDEGATRLCGFAACELTKLKPTHIISGMALGWDIAIAEAAVAIGVPFTAAVPFRGQENAWPEKSRKHYRAMLLLAAKVVYVSDPPYAAWKMQARNVWMAKNCDMILALWNGTDGGTANCLEYARLVARKPIENAWERWEVLT